MKEVMRWKEEGREGDRERETELRKGGRAETEHATTDFLKLGLLPRYISFSSDKLTFEQTTVKHSIPDAQVIPRAYNSGLNNKRKLLWKLKIAKLTDRKTPLLRGVCGRRGWYDCPQSALRPRTVWPNAPYRNTQITGKFCSTICLLKYSYKMQCSEIVRHTISVEKDDCYVCVYILHRQKKFPKRTLMRRPSSGLLRRLCTHKDRRRPTTARRAFSLWRYSLTPTKRNKVKYLWKIATGTILAAIEMPPSQETHLYRLQTAHYTNYRLLTASRCMRRLPTKYLYTKCTDS